MELKKNYYILLHPKPDVDSTFSVALLKNFSEIKIGGFLFGRENVERKDVLCVDAGGKDFDHHGMVGVTSTDLVARKLNLENEKWLQRILKFVKRADLRGMSLPFDVTTFQKAIIRKESVSDEKAMEIGLRMAEDIIEFSKENLRRENLFGKEIMKEFLQEKRAYPEIFTTYLDQLSRENFERPLDFVEIVTAEKKLRGEIEAKKFGKFILEFIFEDWEKYQLALKEIEKSQKIQAGKYLIISGQSDNPKFNVAARTKGASIIIQKNKSGNVQIFFKRGKVNKKIADEIVINLRKTESELENKELPKEELSKEGWVENWYYFVGKIKDEEASDFFILNGSLTAKGIKPTKIPVQRIIKIVKKALEKNHFYPSRHRP
jgi:hypothetical protein